ncbi:hypothetical protein CUMW_168040, partial [Citrus unshiu]
MVQLGPFRICIQVLYESIISALYFVLRFSNKQMPRNTMVYLSIHDWTGCSAKLRVRLGLRLGSCNLKATALKCL